MACTVHRLHHLVTAAAACGDLLAVSTPEHKVALHTWPGGRHLADLDVQHEAPIAGLAFAAAAADRPLRLVSASHDRNSYVLTQRASAAGSNGTSASSMALEPELVITRLQKAGLCCAWAPAARKFAIGASERAVAVCYLDEARSLWAPRLIKKKHESAVMAVAWHPSGALLATASTDGRLRLFNAVVPEVDGPPAAAAALQGTRFGDCLLELELPGGWGLAVAFSPSGDCLACASQGSQVTLLSGIDLQNPASLDAAAAAATPGRVQHLALPGLLPLKCLAFLADGLLAGGGFDCHPVLCARQADGKLRYVRSLQGQQPSSSSSSSQAAPPPQAASLSARIRLFEQQAAAAGANGSSKGTGSGSGTGRQQQQGKEHQEQQQQEAEEGPHANCIVSIVPLPPPGPGSVAFLTASLEGCLAEWHVDPAALQ